MNNTKEALDQAFEAGRIAERKMAELARIATEGPLSVAGIDIRGREIITPSPGNGPHKRPGRKAKAGPMSAINEKAAGAIKELTVARGVKKASAPRTKGVKDAIVSLIGGHPHGLATGEIIEMTGFKPASVNGTLMGLKKTGQVTQENKLWLMSAAWRATTGNSGDEAVAGAS